MRHASLASTLAQTAPWEGEVSSKLAESDKRNTHHHVSRRAFLAVAAAVTGTAAATVLLGNRGLGQSFGPPLPGVLGSPITAAHACKVRIERVHSTARGRDIDLVTIVPPDVDLTTLPVCVALHGRHGNARGEAGGLPGMITEAIGAHATRPYAFVAVDGGDNYWHRQPSGDDDMAMLLDEVPRWLVERGLSTARHGIPFACIGLSMGGFGALLYARRRLERNQPLNAVAAVSPGLLTSWQEMSKRNAFVDDAEWAALDPVRNVDKLGSVPVGIWCGSEDPFVDGVRQFIRQAHPAVASISPGRHDGAYFGKAYPEAVRFIGKHVP